MLFRYIKKSYLAYSSPVMLISRKVIQDKRIVTDFKNLNVRIAKNNLAYPLLKDTFSVLGSSRCEVLLVLDLKDAFHSLRLSESSERYCVLPYFSSASCLYQKCLWDYIYHLKYLTFDLAILYKCHIRMFTKQKIL